MDNNDNNYQRLLPTPFPLRLEQLPNNIPQYQATQWQITSGCEAANSKPFIMQVLSAWLLYLARTTHETELCIAWYQAFCSQQGKARLAPLCLSYIANLTFKQMIKCVEHAYTQVKQSTTLLAAESTAKPLPKFPVGIAIDYPDYLDNALANGGSLLTLEIDSIGLRYRWIYDAGSIANAQMLRIVEHISCLLYQANLVQQADTPVAQLVFLPAAERELVVTRWNDTAVVYPQNKCLHQLVEEQARCTPHAIAVEDEIQQLSYSDLERRANQLAHYLHARGVKPDSCVAVCLERSVAMVVAILAILKAGGAYVPLLPQLPAKRLQEMVIDCQPVCILLDATGERTWQAVEHTAPLIRVDSNILWAKEAVTSVEGVVKPEHLAYVIYTSGTTGKPKGVMNEHRGIVNRLHAMQQMFELTPQDVVLQKTPYSFDISVWEFFWPLLAGAKLVMARPEGHKDPLYLSEIIAKKSITIVHFVPSMLQIFLAAGVEHTKCMSVKRVMCTGEALPVPLVKQFYAAFPAIELYNLYGPTEAAVEVTTWACPQHEEIDRVLIGNPIANTQIYVLDEQQQPCPIGMVGELFIGGVQVARGYLNRPELTAKCFIPDPFSDRPEARLYRTGDLGCWLSHGTLECLGRNDEQVKIRGFRVEPAEIALCLMAHSSVREAVVLARGEGADKHLVAWWVAKPNCVTLTPADLRVWLSQHLPDYTIPQSYVQLTALPLTPNGKLDRHALPQPSSAALAHADYQAAQTTTEAMLVAMWCSLLPGIEQVGRNDNFFALGGSSLLALQLVTRINQAGFALSLYKFFATPVLADLAEQLDNPLATLWGKAIAVRSQGLGSPLFFFPTGLGDYSYIFEIAKEIDPAWPVYALPWPTDMEKCITTMSELVEWEVATLRKVQPRGPYQLAGYSSGGVLAWAVAQRLLDAGEQVSFLGLIDTLCPPVATLKNAVEILILWLTLTQKIADKHRLEQLRSLALPELIAQLQEVGIVTEAAVWQRCAHFDELMEGIKVKPLDLCIHLFKAKEEEPVFLQDAQFNKHWQKIRQSGYCREDASPLMWDNYLPSEKIIVRQVNGDHYTMMQDAVYRRELAKYFNEALTANN